MQEYLDIFDRNEKHLGNKTREACHKANVNFYHKVAYAWLINSKKEILIQKRALTKKSRPGCWDEISVAGHVLKGETTEQACLREIYEELGINVNQTKFLTKWVNDESKEIIYFFAVSITQAPSQFKLQKDEVADAKFISFNKFKNMLISNTFGEYPQEYKELIITQLKKYLNH